MKTLKKKVSACHIFSFKCIFKVIIHLCNLHFVHHPEYFRNKCLQHAEKKRKSQKWDEQNNLLTVWKCFKDLTALLKVWLSASQAGTRIFQWSLFWRWVFFDLIPSVVVWLLHITDCRAKGKHFNSTNHCD